MRSLSPGDPCLYAGHPGTYLGRYGSTAIVALTVRGKPTAHYVRHVTVCMPEIGEVQPASQITSSGEPT